MVVEEPTVWAFDDLRLKAEELRAQAATAVERGLARVFLRKIDRFERIRDHHAALSTIRREVERVRRQPDPSAPPSAAPGPAVAVGGSFDGVGRLTPVVSEKLDAPRYALMDETGAVRCYVTPSPGVPLRYYIGQRVGVNGTRGYIPEQRAYHIMARHVSALGGGRLR